MATKFFKWVFWMAALFTIPLSLYTLSKLESVDGHIQKVEEVLKREQGSLQRDSLLNLLVIKDIKETVFINQLDKQIDSILTYVTILFGIFGLLGFTAFQFYIEEIREEQRKIRKDALESKSEIRDSIGNSFMVMGTILQEKENWGDAIFKYINAIDNYVEGYIPSEEENEKDFYKVIFALLDSIETCMTELRKETDTNYHVSKDDMVSLKKAFKSIILNIEDGGIEQRMERVREDFLKILRVKE